VKYHEQEVVIMGRKIAFELGPGAIGLIALAVVIGYFLGSTYPFNSITSHENDPPNSAPSSTAPSSTDVAGYSQSDIKRWAVEIGLDSNQFDACFDSRKYFEQIQLEYAQGLDVKISATPSFLIGSHDQGFVYMTGAQTFDDAKLVIDSYLNGTAPAMQVALTEDPIGNSSFIGNRNAEVMIIEFSDFQCPFCRAFYTNTLPLIESEYLDTGKAVLVHKEFPLIAIHPGAEDYGLAAKCAGEQGAWREMHDKIFDEQNKIGPGTIPYG
jgi:protein-disulfide isomerase